MKDSKTFTGYFKTVLLLAAATLLLVLLINVTHAQEAEFKPSGKVWGYAFGDVFYKIASDTQVSWGSGQFAKNKEKDFQFIFRRIYLGYDYRISQKLTSRILLENNELPSTTDARRLFFLKRLDIEWKGVIPRGSILVGLSPVPAWVPVTEEIWNYRSVEKTILDYRGLSNAVDFGITAMGSIDTGGIISYRLMLANGGGVKLEDNSLKRIYGALTFKLLKKKLTVDIYGDYEDAARYGDLKSNITFRGFAAYEINLFTIGVDVPYQMKKDAKMNTADVPADTADVAVFGFAVFARATIIKDKLFAFARYDNFNPDLNYKKGDLAATPYDEGFITAGIDFVPHKNWHIIPNIWVNTYQDKRESSDAKYYARKADVVARITFYFIFK